MVLCYVMIMPPDYYPARRIKARTGPYRPNPTHFSQPLRAIRAYTRGKNQVAMCVIKHNNKLGCHAEKHCEKQSVGGKRGLLKYNSPSREQCTRGNQKMGMGSFVYGVVVFFLFFCQTFVLLLYVA